MWILLKLIILTIKIVGIKLESTNDFSYQTALIIDGVKFCSGALISENFVITAANCLHDAFEVDVILDGRDLLNELSPAFICTSFIIHENFSAISLANNVALIKLPVDKGENGLGDIRTLGLPTGEPSNGDKLTLTGFRLNGKLVSRQVKVDDENCLGNSELIFCVTSFEDREDGDNDGGPLVGDDGTLIGILTFVNNSAIIATKIHPYVGWIQSKLTQ